MCTIVFSFILGEDVISSCPTQQMRSCNHEEADTRILVHVKDALAKGARSVLVRTVDTDVVVILVAQFHTFSLTWPGTSFWVAFGMGKHFQLLSINSICEYLGEQKCRALPFFHAFTGCDTTSAFLGKGKKSAWEAWNAYPDVTEAFLYANDSPFLPLQINSPVFNVLQRFVVVLYDRTSLATDVNTARRELFTKKNRALENIPPTEANAERINKFTKRRSRNSCHKPTLPVADPLSNSFYPNKLGATFKPAERYSMLWIFYVGYTSTKYM